MADALTRMTFVARTVLKRDAFSETLSGYLAEDPDRKVVLRRLSGVRPPLRAVAWCLARREARALQAVAGLPGVPQLLRVDGAGVLRSWLDGTPLQLARPDDPAWFRDARRLLRAMRRRGVTHNDLAKPQNWLCTPDGQAAVVDFQLATLHRRRGKLFRVMAREDLRHLLKQKRAFAPHLLTASEKAMLARKSLPSRIWMATGKRIYNFVTRRLMNWSDSEGLEDRLTIDGAAVAATLKTDPRVSDVALCAYALPAKGVGLYVFAETDLGQDALQALLPEAGRVLLQPVTTLPRWDDGTVRQDVLQLIATNRLDELEMLTVDDPQMAAAVGPIVAGRLNLTDRILIG